MSADRTANPKYAVHAALFSEAIYVGRVNADRTAFAEKEDLADMVLAAVAQYVERNFDGGLYVTFPGLGIALTAKVTALVNAAAETDEHTTTEEADR